ncbi:UDP-N-acetylmuramoyl-L-alanine--D-glutamate ligase [Flavobacteriaceae bacterium]|nr:UDP-N-acetylmuramoyl-L-alanine--D-glutamate ligase [Flavobacteriaceae bacterium]MDC0858332.1 UDP-N-acetylmuramoyl-L-alanine--D-glutamate ligase [Flavobacteriaceae bacterium]
MKKNKIVILGGGESGIGTAILGKKEGFEVFVSDYGKIKKKYKQVLLHYEINWEEEAHSETEILSAGIVMKSPGISENTPIVLKLKKKGIRIVSEIEFAATYTSATLIGITGSNGKTTVATMIHKILKDAGNNAAIAGNIGKSFAELVATKDINQFVLELSSFQLDGTYNFAPHIAILTNLSPDHLDRYDNDYEKYIASKFKIVMNQKSDDYFIYDADDLMINKWISNTTIKSQLIPFSLQKELKKGAYIKNNELTITTNNNTFTMSITKLGQQGQHNIKNAMAASTASTLLNIRKATIRRSLENFQGVEHRLENVLKINNVRYINDSKGTNVNATFYALDSMEASTVWIVGGVDKGNDYSELFALVNEKVKAIICLGVDNEKIIKAFGNVVDIMVETHSMEDAVKVAYRLSKKGDNVLLSPACASFDLFENYEDRGRQFKNAVRNL